MSFTFIVDLLLMLEKITDWISPPNTIIPSYHTPQYNRVTGSDWEIYNREQLRYIHVRNVTTTRKLALALLYWGWKCIKEFLWGNTCWCPWRVLAWLCLWQENVCCVQSPQATSAGSVCCLSTEPLSPPSLFVVFTVQTGDWTVHKLYSNISQVSLHWSLISVE